MGTIYTGKYQNHSIRVDNSFSRCKLFIDGIEKDVIKGLTPQEGANTLRSVIHKETGDSVVEVVIDLVPIKKGAFIRTSGNRFVVKINGEFFATGFLSRSQQKKYGELLKYSSEASKKG